jgi:hypothetical protein
MGGFAFPGQAFVTVGGRRVIAPGGVASIPFAGALEVLDFVTGYYRSAGTEYASAAAAGWTVSGGTFDANGYTPTGTNVISKTVNLPGDFIVFGEFVQPDTAAVRQLWRHAGTGTPQLIRLTTGEYLEVPDAGATSSNATKTASGRSGGLAKVSFDKGSVSTGASASIPGSATFYIGNTMTPFDAPFNAAIKRIAIYNTTLSDAQIQGLG